MGKSLRSRCINKQPPYEEVAKPMVMCYTLYGFSTIWGDKVV